MSVKLFIQDRSGDHNVELIIDTWQYAREAIALIVKEGGYWADGELNPVQVDSSFPPNIQMKWTDSSRSIFIPLHRIDRMEILD